MTSQFTETYKRDLRTLARQSLGLASNAPLKKMIDLLNKDTATKFTEQNFYANMNKYYKHLETVYSNIEEEEQKQEQKKQEKKLKEKVTERVKTEIKKKYQEKAETKTKQQKVKREKKEQTNKISKYYKKKEPEQQNLWTYNINNGIGKFVSQLSKQAKGKNIVVDVIEYKKKIRSVRVEVGINFWNWWETIGTFIFIYPIETSIFGLYPNATLFIYEGQELNKNQFKQLFQVFKEADNGKCVFNPIRKWAQSKYDDAVEKKNKSIKSRYNIILKKLDELEVKYVNGVNENNIEELCNELQIDITIEKPLSNIPFIVSKSIKKGLKHFKYINTRINHVELNEYVLNNNPIIMTRSELLELKDELQKEKIYHPYKKDLTNISKIYTLKGVYAVSNVMQEIFNDFEIETGLVNCKIDDINDKVLSRFINQGTHYNGTIDFKPLGYWKKDKYIHNYNLDDVFHIDMSKAYTRFNICEFYEGFLGKITDFRLTNKIEGVGLYYIYKLVIPDGAFKKYNDKLKIYLSHNIYTSAELKFLEKQNCSFKICYGCWGVNPIDFEFNLDMIDGKHEGNSYYALWTGKCDSHHLQKKIWINGNDDMANLIASHTNAKIETYGNGEICVKYDKDHNYHLGHITAFITAYQRLNVLEQLEHIEYDNIIRVCVDGIYTENKVMNLKNAFRYKNDIEDKTFENIAGVSYISNVNMNENVSINDRLHYFLENEMEYAKQREHNNKELHIGAGGNGKTHKNLTDTGLVKLLYIAPSWKLARNKNKEYNCDVNVWAKVITKDPLVADNIKRNYNVLLFDEVSMMNEEQKLQIFNMYSDMKIIFCGDLGNQLSCIEGTEMNETGFDKIIENNINYRCTDNRLLKLLEKLREMIKEKKNVYQINSYVNRVFENYNKIIDDDELKDIYKVEDMILVGTKAERDKYTDMFLNLKKYYCNTNSRLYSKGEIIIGDKPITTTLSYEKIIEEPIKKRKNSKLTVKKEEEEFVLRHSYTTHSIQGETAHNNLYINSKTMWDPRMFYTAISRAKSLDQIYILQD